MAKELMEIGGFITEGAEIVNHDNSLSGNGTVESPLGLSNETILYSGAMVSSVNLSEPLSSFDRVKIYYASDFTEKTGEHIVADIDASNGSHYWTPVAGLGLENAWISMNLFSANNDYTVLTCPQSKLINFGKYNVTGTALAGATTGINQSIIYKVVGVNRKV